VSSLAATLDGALILLREQEAPAALVGGLAVSVRAEPRFTRDIDLAIAVPDDHAAEAVARAFLSRGYLSVATIEQDAAGRLATLRLVRRQHGEPGPVLDLLFASSGVEAEIVAAAELVEVFPGVTAALAGIGDLVALKVLARDDARRPQDRVDLHALLRTARTEEIARARDLLALVTHRGFHRGRDLEASLEAALAEFSWGR
jgi:predicted nucleotidyltransferase